MDDFNSRLATTGMPSFLVIDKTMQGSNKNAAYRAYRRIAPKSVEVILLPHFVARTFCGRLIEKHAHNTEYFDPGRDWPHPLEGHMNIPLDLQQLFFVGDTRSRRELLVFAQANPSRLPLAMGISQPGIPVRRGRRQENKGYKRTSPDTTPISYSSNNHHRGAT